MASSSIFVRPPSKDVISVAMLFSFEALSLKHEIRESRSGLLVESACADFPASPVDPAAHADEVDETANGIIGKVDRRGENRIDARKHRLDRPHRCAQVRIDPGGGRVVSAHRREDIQVMPHGILQRGERAVVKERRLERHIADGRGAEFVTVIRVAGDLLQAEVLVAARPVERHIADEGAICGTPMTCAAKSLNISFDGPDTA